jgi:hypothetical protein
MRRTIFFGYNNRGLSSEDTGAEAVGIFLDVCLGVEDGGIVVRFLAVKNDKGGLAVALHIDLESFGADDGYLTACVLFHQVYNKIKPGIGPAAGIDIFMVKRGSRPISCR